MSEVICPHCENVEMDHHIHRDTHIYICPDCPNVMIEYSDESDIENLRSYFSNKNPDN